MALLIGENLKERSEKIMIIEIEPNLGADKIKFNLHRSDARKIVGTEPVVKSFEPENDFYEENGLIIGYDDEDLLEYIEIIPPSSAMFDGVDLLKLTPSECLKKINEMGYFSEFDDGGYNFEEIGVVLYCPFDIVESVSLYRKGYYN